MAARGKRPPNRPPAVATTPAQEQTTTTQIAMQRQEWKGPLPPPEALRAFEDIHPGAAKAIVDEFRAEAAHRRKQEDREAHFRVWESHVGQGSAIVFALSALGVAAFAAAIGAEWVGGVIGTGVIVSGIIALRTGRKR